MAGSFVSTSVLESSAGKRCTHETAKWTTSEIASTTKFFFATAANSTASFRRTGYAPSRLIAAAASTVYCVSRTLADIIRISNISACHPGKHTRIAHVAR